MKHYYIFLISLFFSIESIAQCTDDGNYWNNSWVSCEVSTNPNPIRGNSHWLLFEFDENQYIDSSYVWNANRLGESSMGMNQVIVDYSLDGTTWLELGTYNFPQAPETNNYEGFQGPNFGNVFLNKILITVVSTHGDPNCASIAEVQFKIDPNACYGAYDACGVCNGPGESIWYLDADNDGLGDIATEISTCVQPIGYVSNNSDVCDNGALGWNEIGALFVNNGCMNCHGNDAQGGLNLSSYASTALGGNICGPNLLMGQNLVGAITVSGYDACGSPIPIPNMNDRVGGNMDPTEIAMIQAWIDGGAPEFCHDYSIEGGTANIGLKVFLEGAYEANSAKMKSDLMLGNLLPLQQPYNIAPYNYFGPETLNTNSNEVIDWVLVEMRSGINPDSKIESKAGILLEDGRIKSPDGINDLSFTIPTDGEYYFLIRHRNHLDIMTATPIKAAPSMYYDFTLDASQAYGPQQQAILIDGTPAMFAADCNADLSIQTTDYDIWRINPAILNVYNPADVNLDGTVQTTDYDLWFNNKAKLGIPEIGY